MISINKRRQSIFSEIDQKFFCRLSSFYDDKINIISGGDFTLSNHAECIANKFDGPVQS